MTAPMILFIAAGALTLWVIAATILAGATDQPVTKTQYVDRPRVVEVEVDRPPGWYENSYRRHVAEREALAHRVGVLEHQVTELRRLAEQRGVAPVELRALDDARSMVLGRAG